MGQPARASTAALAFAALTNSGSFRAGLGEDDPATGRGGMAGSSSQHRVTGAAVNRRLCAGVRRESDGRG